MILTLMVNFLCQNAKAVTIKITGELTTGEDSHGEGFLVFYINGNRYTSLNVNSAIQQFRRKAFRCILMRH